MTKAAEVETKTETEYKLPLLLALDPLLAVLLAALTAF
jgi:hypothetical protein